jgi:hypothetical protein
MPRYYFHLHDDLVTEDEDGTVFPDDAAALAKAHEEARYLAAESIRSSHRLVLHHCIVVADEQGTTLARVTFGSAFAIDA